MKDTIVYLIRHAETVDENGIRNTSEDSQLINEKEILSVEGEEQAKRLSENEELQNLDVIWSSSYTRAKATAKYIANVNDLPFNLDNNLSERKLGNLKELGEFMKDKNTRDPSQEQLLDRTFRTSDGESAEQTRERMNKFFDKILKEYEGKRISKRSVQNIIKSELVELVEAEGKESKKYHTHTLRHTGATLLYNEANANIFVLKIILGHESLDATQVYTHVSDKKLKELMQNFNILDRKE